MKRAIFLLVSIAFTGALFAQGIQFNNNDWKRAVEKAQLEDKIIFVDGYTTWCEPCKMMDIQVFNRYTVGDFFNSNFVNLKMDMEKGRGPIFALNYGVTNFPAFLFLTSDGTLVHKIDGYKHAPDLIRLSRPALDPELKLMAWHKRYTEGDRKPDFLYNYVYVKYDEMNGSHKPVVQEYLDTQKDWTQARNIHFVYNFIEEVDSEMFNIMAKNRKAFEKELGAEKVRRTIDLLVNNKIYNSQPAPPLTEVERLFLMAYPAKGQYLVSTYKLDHYQKLGDELNYTLTAMDHYQKWPPDDRSVFTGLAWKVYEIIDDPDRIKMAERWSRQALKKDKSIDNYLLLASLQYKKGLKKEAKKTAKAASKIARKSKSEKLNEIKALQDRIKKMD